MEHYVNYLYLYGLEILDTEFTISTWWLYKGNEYIYIMVYLGNCFIPSEIKSSMTNFVTLWPAGALWRSRQITFVVQIFQNEYYLNIPQQWIWLVVALQRDLFPVIFALTILKIRCYWYYMGEILYAETLNIKEVLSICYLYHYLQLGKGEILPDITLKYEFIFSTPTKIICCI